MTVEAILFYFFATILVAASAAVITVRNPVHAALFLVLAALAFFLRMMPVPASEGGRA